jgi:hypothetical protein
MVLLKVERGISRVASIRGENRKPRLKVLVRDARLGLGRIAARSGDVILSP